MHRYICCGSEQAVRFNVCGQLVCPDGFLHTRRTFDLNVLIIVTEGTLCITSDNTPYTVGAGQLIFLRAGEEHYGTAPSKGRLSYLWVHFSAEAEACDAARSGCACCFPENFRLTDFGRAVQLFNMLMSISLDDGADTSGMTDCALRLLLMEITREAGESGEHSGGLPSAVISARAWIKNHYCRPFDMSELAQSIGYSADYLSAIFKKHTGISVTQFTNRLRIKAAKTLLASFGTSVRETAYSCGFTDDKYFIRVFRQYEGITPAEYRRTLGRKNIN